MQQAAVDAICAGKPFIALGLTDVPEAALVCGCSENGDALYGWSHYQAGMETIENGMFVKKDWMKDTWELIIPTERSQRTITVRDVIADGVRILSQNETEGYLSGFAAYDHWISEIVSSKGTDSRLFGYHHAILFNLAEARCWCGDFLLKHGVEAGNHFKNIHDLCWKADAAVHAAADMAEDGKKQALIGVMKAIREEDRAALNELKAML